MKFSKNCIKRLDRLKFALSCKFLNYSISTRGNSLSKFVYISESDNIFVNLAFEDWLYENYDFSKQQILFLWRNRPCIVIGRHQNPWLEANVDLAQSSNTIIARRNSGGGTVYHDLENLNLSFFTSKDSYNRKHNLEIITNSLRDEWSINAVINCREDIIVGTKKISGTASKLSKNNAYHHCTLLVDCNKKTMSALLGSKNTNIVTNATHSVPSPVTNLRESNLSVNVDRLMTVVGMKYLFASSLSKSKDEHRTITPKGFHFVRPEQKFFAGLDKKIEQFSSWDWIFGRTPKFKAEYSFPVTRSCSSATVTIFVEVEHALLQKVNVTVPPSFLVFATSESFYSITAPLLQQKFSRHLVSQIEEVLINYFSGKFQDERLNSVLQ